MGYFVASVSVHFDRTVLDRTVLAEVHEMAIEPHWRKISQH
jgi:hypothetical protein